MQLFNGIFSALQNSTSEFSQPNAFRSRFSRNFAYNNKKYAPFIDFIHCMLFVRVKLCIHSSLSIRIECFSFSSISIVGRSLCIVLLLVFLVAADAWLANEASRALCLWFLWTMVTMNFHWIDACILFCLCLLPLSLSLSPSNTSHINTTHTHWHRLVDMFPARFAAIEQWEYTREWRKAFGNDDECCLFRRLECFLHSNWFFLFCHYNSLPPTLLVALARAFLCALLSASTLLSQTKNWFSSIRSLSFLLFLLWPPARRQVLYVCVCLCLCVWVSIFSHVAVL